MLVIRSEDDGPVSGDPNAVDLRILPVADDDGAWQRAAGELLGLSLLQTAAYGDTNARKRAWSIERGIFVGPNGVEGGFQAMVRRLPGGRGGLVWLNRAPLWRESATKSLPTIAQQHLSLLRRHYVNEGGMYLRIAPAWREGAIPESVYSESGFQVTHVSGWASSVIDLGRPIDDLRAALHAKWRNALVQAEREDTTQVRHAADGAAMERFLSGYATHIGQRRYDTNLEPDFLRRLQTRLPQAEKMIFLTAEQDGHILGGVALARFGATIEYLAGFNDTRGRAANVGQLLLWRSLVLAQQEHARWFDLGGMDSDRTPPGIYRFKHRAGGAEYRLAPEIESHDGGLLARLVRWRVGRARSDG